MNELKELRDIVEQLANIEEKGPAGRCKRVHLLQKINEKLLSAYYIEIDDNFKIYPLLVEAYYYDKGKFEDGSTHGSNKQKSESECRFGKLYFHQKGRGGIDICLSCGKYYLSFLIKNSMVYKPGVKKFCSQIELYDELNAERERDNSIEERIVLRKPEGVRCELLKKEEWVILHTIRKGLSSIEKRLLEDQLSKEERIKAEKALPFAYERLAAVKGFALRDQHDKPYKFALESGYSKSALVAEYIHAHTKYKQASNREIDEMVEKILGKGYKKSSIKSQLEMLE